MCPHGWIMPTGIILIRKRCQGILTQIVYKKTGRVGLDSPAPFLSRAHFLPGWQSPHGLRGGSGIVTHLSRPWQRRPCVHRKCHIDRMRGWRTDPDSSVNNGNNDDMGGRYWWIYFAHRILVFQCACPKPMPDGRKFLPFGNYAPEKAEQEVMGLTREKIKPRKYEELRKSC
jgi:hypothetical protein